MNIQQLGEWSTYIYLILTMAFTYALYYYLFAYFVVQWKTKEGNSARKIGRTVPPYPNGWYIACKSQELAPGNSKSVDIAGENMVLFRSTKGDVHALHAYCSHLGANLGVGGKVVNNDCI